MDVKHRGKTWLGFLPRNWRYEILRRSFKLCYEWPRELRLKISSTSSEFEAAFRLSHDSRVAAGYMDPDPSGMHVLRQHLMPQSAVLIALWEDRVVGTVTLIRENPMGLPLERVFDPSIYRMPRGRAAELTCMAIAPEFRKGLGRIFFPLLKFAFHFAKERFGVNRLVAAVHPLSVDMYEAVLGLDVIHGQPRPEGLIKGSPSVAVRADLEGYVGRLADLYNGHSVTTDLSRYLTSSVMASRFQLPTRDFHHVRDFTISPKTMEELFFKKARMGEWLSAQDRMILARQYPHQNYIKIIESNEPEVRGEWRVETRLPAKLGLTRSHSEVWDVSRSGLRLLCSTPLEVGSKVRLRIDLNRSVQAFIDCEVRWRSGKDLYGLKIESSNQIWSTMIRNLESHWENLAGASIEESRAGSLA